MIGVEKPASQDNSFVGLR